MALSSRLRGALLALYRLSGEPGPEQLVVRSAFHRREWARIVKKAGIGDRAFKDLRDTFGSQLGSAGVPLAHVARQLGHADVAVTARHYARWTGGDDYREPVRLLPGEVPADLVARLALESDPTVTPLDETAEGAELANPRPLLEETWSTRPGSNRRHPRWQRSRRSRKARGFRLGSRKEPHQAAVACPFGHAVGTHSGWLRVRLDGRNRLRRAPWGLWRSERPEPHPGGPSQILRWDGWKVRRARRVNITPGSAGLAIGAYHRKAQ